MNGTDWAAALGNLPGIPEVTAYRWLSGDDLRKTWPSELWVGYVHDATWEGEE